MQEKISDIFPIKGMNPCLPESEGQRQEYKIGERSFLLQSDFTYEELEWLDVVYERLQVGSQKSEVRSQNEIKGNFTRDEIEKTLKILLIPLSPPLLKGEKGAAAGGFTHEDFLKTRENQSVKIIADFFLMRAMLGFFIKRSLMN